MQKVMCNLGIEAKQTFASSISKLALSSPSNIEESLLTSETWIGDKVSHKT